MEYGRLYLYLYKVHWQNSLPMPMDWSEVTGVSSISLYIFPHNKSKSTVPKLVHSVSLCHPGLGMTSGSKGRMSKVKVTVLENGQALAAHSEFLPSYLSGLAEEVGQSNTVKRLVIPIDILFSQITYKQQDIPVICT